MCSLMWVSFFCYFANSVADHVSENADIAYGLNWFDHPVAMQKYVILIIVRANERIEFSGFGLITCSMEMFEEVCIFLFRNMEALIVHSNTILFWSLFQLFKSACSYYLVFREFSQR